MFVDESYLFDAGWLFFAVWTLGLFAFFLIAFGEDLLFSSQRGNAGMKEAQGRALPPDPRGRWF